MYSLESLEILKNYLNEDLSQTQNFKKENFRSETPNERSCEITEVDIQRLKVYIYIILYFIKSLRGNINFQVVCLRNYGTLAFFNEVRIYTQC